MARTIEYNQINSTKIRKTKFKFKDFWLLEKKLQFLHNSFISF